MKNKVITVARGYGSGGRTMGKMLAEELGWDYYDTELLTLASNESGINETLFVKADETAKRTFLKRVSKDAADGEPFPPSHGDYLSEENLFRYQAMIIRRLAEKGNCVIVGRCANYILRNWENVLSLYVHAPAKVCVRTVMNLYAKSQDEAEKVIRETDDRRSAYYYHYTGRDWQCADDYDLCIDSSKMSWDQCIAIVKAYLDNM